MGVSLDILKDRAVIAFLKRVGGEKAPKVIQLTLKAGNAVTDEQIANKLGVKVTVVRAVFNRLHYWGLADYDKTRDEQTGWYTYTWHILPEKIFAALEAQIEEEISELKEKLEELTRFMLFECSEGHVRIPFEVAAEYEFRCPECGRELQPVDTEREKQKIREEIRRRKELIEKLKEYQKALVENK